METDIAITLAIIAMALILFISEWLAIDTVSILVMLAFMVVGILSPEEGFRGFTNPATLTVGAMFVISSAIFKTGALNPVKDLLKNAQERGYFFLLLVLMLVTSLLSATINNTAVVALLIPVLLELSHRREVSASRLLMPLSFAGILGGVCTLIGTSTNMLASGIAESRGLKPIGMFEMTLPGLCFLLAGLAYMLLAGPLLLPRRDMGDSLEDIYGLGQFITKIRILPASPISGVQLGESALAKSGQLEVLQIAKENGQKLKPALETTLQANDIITVLARPENLREIAASEGFELVMYESLDVPEDMKETRVFEALIAPESQFAGKLFSEIPLGIISETASVLGIRSRRKLMTRSLDEVRLRAGDILLVQANPEDMRHFHQSEDLLVITQLPEMEEDSSPKMWLAILTLLGVVGAAALGLAPIVLAASIGAALLVILKAIRPQQAYEAIDWKVIFMLAGVLSMGTALEKTGADGLLADVITGQLAQYGPRFVLSAFFIITLLVSNVMSNNASVALMAPIAITVAAELGVEHRPFLLAVTFAASLSFMMPMGYQTNTMIYTPGSYKVRDYLRVGGPLTLLFWVLATLILPWFFPF